MVSLKRKRGEARSGDPGKILPCPAATGAICELRGETREF